MSPQKESGGSFITNAYNVLVMEDPPDQVNSNCEIDLPLQ